MNKFFESLKYFTVLFQLRNKYLDYIKAVILYKLKNEVKFPKTIVNLKNLKFISRENSMDIAHLSNFYERETTNLLLNLNPKIFIDVGAHIGRFSILLAKNGSKVVSLEPSKKNFKQLNKNIKINKLKDKIKTLNIGCSDKNGKTTLYFNPFNEGSSSLRKINKSKPERIQTKKLDNICKSLNIDFRKINVIKIDVEGFELNVLKGSLNLLKIGKPLLIVEILEEKKEQEIKKFLKNFGFVNKKILDSRNFIFEKIN